MKSISNMVWFYMSSIACGGCLLIIIIMALFSMPVFGYLIIMLGILIVYGVLYLMLRKINVFANILILHIISVLQFFLAIHYALTTLNFMNYPSHTILYTCASLLFVGISISIIFKDIRYIYICSLSPLLLLFCCEDANEIGRVAAILTPFISLSIYGLLLTNFIKKSSKRSFSLVNAYRIGFSTAHRVYFIVVSLIMFFVIFIPLLGVLIAGTVLTAYVILFLLPIYLSIIFHNNLFYKISVENGFIQKNKKDESFEPDENLSE